MLIFDLKPSEPIPNRLALLVRSGRRNFRSYQHFSQPKIEVVPALALRSIALICGYARHENVLYASVDRLIDRSASLSEELIFCKRAMLLSVLTDSKILS